MAIKVLGWNVYEGLALPARSQGIVEAVKRHDADVVVLSDAYWLGNPTQWRDDENKPSPEVAAKAIDDFHQAGYVDVRAEYSDQQFVRPRRYLLMLSRLAIQGGDFKLGGDRRGVEATVKDPDNFHWQIIGAHFDDRYKHNRQKQAEAVTGLVDGGQPAALIGDLNLVHTNDRIPALMRSRFVRKRVPNISDHARRDKAARLVSISEDGTLEKLAAAGLREADPRHRATAPASLPAFQLDHILVTEPVHVTRFKVERNDSSSDHRAISAKLTI